MIFAREISGPLTSLVKQLDEATANQESKKLGSFVAFLSDDTGIAEKLIALSEKEKIKHTVLGFIDAKGPEDYEVAAEADVTVVFYVGRVVKANHAFRKGKMTAADVTRIIGDLAKVLPSK